MPETAFVHKNHSDILSYEQIELVAKVAAGLGTGDRTSWGEVDFTATDQIRLGVGIRPNNNQGAGLVYLLTSGAAELISLRGNHSLSTFYLYVDGVQEDSAVVLDTSYQHIGMDVKIDSVSGWARVYKDGIEIMSFDGDTGTDDIAKLRLGTMSEVASYLVYFDDVFIDDSAGETSPIFVPVKKFDFVLPNGNGNYAQWTGSDGNQTDNYLLVDEVPPDDDTTYVVAVSGGFYDSYDMDTVTLGSGQEFVAVIPTVCARREGSTEQIALGTRLSSTDLVSSGYNLGTTYGTIWERQITKPGSGAWGQSDVNNMEVVIVASGVFFRMS